MKKMHLMTACLSLAVCIANGQPVDIPFTSGRWDKQNAQTSLETFEGKECLLIKSGDVLLKDLSLQDGIIECDMSFPQQRGFPGILFRVLDAGNSEVFYVRPHQSGNPDATQYTPVFNGLAGWQLYHGEGYSKAIPFRFNQWHHIKIDVHGRQAEIYIDDMDNAFMRVTELKRDPKAGTVAFTSGGVPVRFANFRYTAKAPVSQASAPVPANGTHGLITQWQVSNQSGRELFAGALELTPALKSKFKWTTQRTEPSGTLNLAKFTRANDSGRVMIAKLIIQSEKDQVKPLSFGFSDYVMVYLNDKALYLGRDNFLSRDYRFLGTIGFFDMIFLPLKKGANELWLVVSEDFGGWGVKAKMEDMIGVELK